MVLMKNISFINRKNIKPLTTKHLIFLYILKWIILFLFMVIFAIFLK